MLNFKSIVESSLIECKIDILYINKAIGNTIQNHFKLICRQDELEIIETFAPDLVIEKFKGKSHSFACALAINLMSHYGTIQFAYVEKSKNNSNLFELVGYYSKTNALDETTRNQMLFYHSQQNLDLEYLTLAQIVEHARFYPSVGTFGDNDTHKSTY